MGLVDLPVSTTSVTVALDFAFTVGWVSFWTPQDRPHLNVPPEARGRSGMKPIARAGRALGSDLCGAADYG